MSTPESVTEYINKFMITTPHCDTMYNLSSLRKDFEKKINYPVGAVYANMIGQDDLCDSERVNRVYLKKLTQKDESICLQAVVHFNMWHRKHLFSALSLSNKLRYIGIEVKRKLKIKNNFT